MDIKVSDVKDLLANGKTRDEIKEHYNLTSKELKFLFQHSKLKGLKTKKPFSPSFEIVDDENEREEMPQASSPVSHDSEHTSH